jgi:hypothetical protein
LLYKRAYSEIGFKAQFKNLAGLSEYDQLKFMMSFQCKTRLNRIK